MRSNLLIACSIVGLGLSNAQDTPDAIEVTDNPVGPVYQATLSENEDSTISGHIRGTAAKDGRGVEFDVSFTGLPEGGSPFAYHIHDQPVPEDGNCTETLAHHDPFARGAETPCDAAQPQTCEVGDLSGKHGKIEGESFTNSYLDLYESTKPGIGAFFGNRSVVIHHADGSRLTCANFALQDDDTPVDPPGNGTQPTPSGTGSIPQPTVSGTGVPTFTPPNPTGSGTPPPFEGGAGRVGVWSVGGIIAAMLPLAL